MIISMTKATTASDISVLRIPDIRPITDTIFIEK